MSARESLEGALELSLAGSVAAPKRHGEVMLQAAFLVGPRCCLFRDPCSLTLREHEHVSRPFDRLGDCGQVPEQDEGVMERLS